MKIMCLAQGLSGGGPWVVVITAAFHGSRSRRFERNKNVFSPSTCKTQYCGELPWLRGSVLDLRPPGREFESCFLRTVSSHSSHHPQDVLLAQFSLYVHKGSLKSDSFHFLQGLSLPFLCVWFFMRRKCGWGVLSLALCIYVISMRTR